METNKIIQGDCLKVLKQMDDNSIAEEMCVDIKRLYNVATKIKHMLLEEMAKVDREQEEKINALS